MNGAPLDVTGLWVHSFEEDTETAAVYRPSGHPFPLSRRPRRELEFRPDGMFVEARPGPDDRLRERRGHWESQGTNQVSVTFPQERDAPFVITVISRTPDTLTIER